jgi:pimeloyl-ACP methyl ester carboxylesterase
MTRPDITSLFHTVQGNGEPLVLIHGLAGSSRWWARNIDALATHFRTYTVDLAGFGSSRRLRRFRLDDAVTLLIEWLDRNGIERASFAGHSMGGLIAAQLAADAPERVERLVLVDAAFLTFDPGLGRRAMGLLRSIGINAIDNAPQLMRDGLRADPISLGLATAHLLRTDGRPFLANIQVPVLIVWGERDTITPLTIGQQLIANIADARLVVIPAAGHNSMWDCPDVFNAEVLAFLG